MSQTEKVVRYFNAARRDYKWFWMSRDSLAMHFGYYDEMVSTHEASLLKMNEVLARYARITLQDRVLDAGCGYGGSAIWLARTLGCRVNGISVVSEQIQEARRFAEHHKVSDLVQFELVDFTQTTYPDASFDIVWALESVVHTDRKNDFLREAYRLLRDGGRLLISEYLLRDTPPLSEEEYASLVPWLEGWAMASLLTASDYCRLLAATGFRHIHTYDLTDHVRRSVNHLGKLRLSTVPTTHLVLVLVQALQAFHLMSAERVNGFKAGLCQNNALHKGLWSYGVLIAEKGP